MSQARISQHSKVVKKDQIIHETETQGCDNIPEQEVVDHELLISDGELEEFAFFQEQINANIVKKELADTETQIERPTGKG